MAVNVDPTWFAGLNDSDFPIAIDPSPATVGGSPSRAYSNTGLTCDPCPVRVGRDTLNVTGQGAAVWRSAVLFDYDFNNWALSGATIHAVNLELSNVTSSPASGSHWVDVYRANSWGFNGFGEHRDHDDGDAPYAFNSASLQSLFQQLLDNQTADVPLMFIGNEGATYSYKQLNDFWLTLTWNKAPYTPQYPPPAPGNGAVIHAGSVTLAATATDPNPEDNDALYYGFELSTSPSLTPALPTCPTPNTGTCPVNLPLPQTYYWRATAYDGHLSTAGPIWSFTRTNAAPTGGGLASPGNGATVTSRALTLVGTAGSDPDEDTLRYWFMGSDSDEPDGSDIDSGWLTPSPEQPPSWPIPDILQDGSTYVWKMYTSDGNGGQAESATWSFKVDLRLGDQTVSPFDDPGPIRVNLATGNSTVQVNSPRFMTVGGPIGLSYTYNSTPPHPALPSPSGPLPLGWTLSTEVSRGAAYSSARIAWDSIVVVDTTGGGHVYRRDTATTNGWRPSTGNDDGMMAVTYPGGSAQATLIDDGVTYVFNSNGKLASVTWARDDGGRSSPNYSFAGPTANPSAMTDPVSGRAINFTYGSSCPAPPAPFVAAPAGMLCRAAYWDGTQTDLYYDSVGRLARIVDPGGKVTDFAYDASGRLNTMRSPHPADAVAAGVRTNNGDANTQIVYDANGRVSTVTAPKALAADANRPSHSYQYLSGIAECFTANAVCTRIDVAGLDPNSDEGRVVYNGAGQVQSDRDATDKTTTYQWDDADRLLSTVDPAGRKTTLHYDPQGRLTDTYGPAPQAWFDNPTRLPLSQYAASTPHAVNRYDEGIQGLATTYWGNTALADAPIAHGTGVGDPSGAVNASWAGSPATGVPADNWSARLTGEILIPTSDFYTFYLQADDGIQLYIDDQQLIHRWSCCGEAASSARWLTAGYHRVRIDYYDATGLGSLRLLWSSPTIAKADVPGANLRPRYGLATSATDADNKTTSIEYGAGVAGLGPEFGLPTATATDPAGVNLRTTTTYQSASLFRRPASRTLPAGNTTTYAYYGNTEAPANPCGGAAANQGGALRATTSPDPDGGGSQTARIEERYHDAASRIVGTRTGTEPWTCVTYDQRGRPVTTMFPAISGYAGGARTVTHNWAVGGNPLVTSVGDTTPGLAAITATVDLLGRTRTYSDAWGKTTTSSYNQAGRLTDVVGPAGAVAGQSQHFDYDAAGRTTSHQLGGVAAATPTYHATTGELQSITYPAGGGNGTSLSSIGRDNSGRITGLTWALNAATVSDTVTRSLAGRVTDETIDGVDVHVGANFGYDGAGRLIDAWVPGHHLTYNYAASGGCGSLTTAGKNANRTGLTDDNGPDPTYCYDQADRLTSTTDARYPGTVGYDSHHNTTTLGAETMTYDSVDRHLSTTSGATTVTYTRDATDRIVARTVTTGGGGGGSIPAPTATAGANTVTTTLVLNKPAGVAAGHILIAGITRRGTSSTTVTPPNGWTLIRSDQNASAGLFSYWHLAGANEPSIYTWNLSSAKAAAGTIAAYTGVDTTNPIDASSGQPNDTATTSIVAPSATTTVANTRVLGLFGINGATTISPPVGMSELGEAASNVSGQSHITIESADAAQALTAPTGTKTAAAAPGDADRTNAQLIALRPAAGGTATTARYGHTGAGGQSDLTLDSTGTIRQRIIAMPGGALVTKQTTGDVWSYPNVHGDIVATAGATGVSIGTPLSYDPYGQALGTLPDNSLGDLDYGWLAQSLEHEGNLATIEMGARQYAPGLGRTISGDSSTERDEYCQDWFDRCDKEALDRFTKMVFFSPVTAHARFQGDQAHCREGYDQCLKGNDPDDEDTWTYDDATFAEGLAEVIPLFPGNPFDQDPRDPDIDIDPLDRLRPPDFAYPGSRWRMCL